MKDGELMRIQDLRRMAREVIEETKWKQKHIAEEVGVSPITLSRALNSDDATGETTLLRVVNRFSEFEVKKETRYHAVGKSKKARGGK